MAGERLERAELGPLGIAGDRRLWVVDGAGRVQTARSRSGLLLLRATTTAAGAIRVDGRHWRDPEVARAVRAAAGRSTRIVLADDEARFDVLPLLVTTDGALAAFGRDPRRLRPNLVIGGADGLAERGWEGRVLRIGAVEIALADLRERCVMTTFDPDTGEQDVEVLLDLRRRFDGRFALNAAVTRPGRIAVGDPVEWVESASVNR